MRSDLDRVCDRLKIRADVTYGVTGKAAENLDDWKRESNPWTVTLRFQRRRLTVPFWTGSLITTEPTAADVLSCLCSDARGGESTFEEFCSDFGYDTDSRKAERLYRECERSAKRVRQFLGDAFDEVANASH